MNYETYWSKTRLKLHIALTEHEEHDSTGVFHVVYFQSCEEFAHLLPNLFLRSWRNVHCHQSLRFLKELHK